MKKMLKFVLIVLGLLLLVGYIIFRFFLSMNMSEEDIHSRMEEYNIDAGFEFYEVEGYQMHYVAYGADTLPTILFIHGSPGSWDAFISYIGDEELGKHARMILVDRIGYGKSSPGEAHSSLEMQVRCIAPILEIVSDDVPLILVGHSFGGPVAFRMAMEFPDKIDGLLILAGLADPEYEHRPAFLGPLRWRGLRWLLPPDLDVSNREIFPLKEELEKMLPMWDQINAEMKVIQGKKDVLVAYQHAEFVEKRLAHLTPEMIYLPEANHFLPWSHYNLVKKHIMEMVVTLEVN